MFFLAVLGGLVVGKERELFDVLVNLGKGKGYVPVCGIAYVVTVQARDAQGLKVGANGDVAKLGGESRRPSFSFPDGRCVPAFSGRLEDPVDDHRVRIGVPISKHRALTFP